MYTPAPTCSGTPGTESTKLVLVIGSDDPDLGHR